jgi:hypothetical protein
MKADMDEESEEDYTSESDNDEDEIVQGIRVSKMKCEKSPNSFCYRITL